MRKKRYPKSQSDPFGLISDIDLARADSWQGKVFVTLDVDWAPDFVIREVDEIIETLGIPATWFITHKSDAVLQLFGRDQYEIGVHPNFAPLLQDSYKRFTINEIVENARKLAPSATAFRCHALVQSSHLLEQMQAAGFSVDCNVFLPYTPIPALSPWRHSEGLVRVPYCWEDDTWVIGECRSPQEVVVSHGLAVVDFHPIHLWLNTESLDRYERVKNDLQNEDFLRSNRNDNSRFGVVTAFRQMIDGVRSQRDQA